jgi:hypothetical protein
VARVGITVGGGANGNADRANGAPQYCQMNARQRARDWLVALRSTCFGKG